MPPTRLPMPAALGAEVQRLIAAFVADEGEPAYLRRIAARMNALPLYRGWVEVVLLDPDGQVLAFDHDVHDAPLDGPVEHVWLMAALVQGSRAYPVLAPLIPPRPPDAQDCPQCSGTGTLPEPIAHMVCHCGGGGWLPG